MYFDVVNKYTLNRTWELQMSPYRRSGEILKIGRLM